MCGGSGRTSVKGLCAVAVAAALWAADTRAADAPPPAADAVAREIIAASGFPGGVCVQVGVTEGRLLTSLVSGGKFLVQGLAFEDRTVAACRQQLQASGAYGRISVDRAEKGELPYVDNLVNILVAEDFPALAAQGPSAGEIWRVLCPQGSAFLGPATLAPETVRQALAQAGIAGADVSRSGPWIRVRKPRPADMDDWPQYRHGADQNMVSLDRVAGNPDRLQWLGPPAISRVSVNNLVTADGRVYYWVLKRGVQQDDPSRFVLAARDAFNGVLLWEREVRGELSPAAPMLAMGGHLYTILELATKRGAPMSGANMYSAGGPVGPLQCLDGATGEVRGSFPGIVPWQVACTDGVLVIRDERGAKMAFDRVSRERLWKTTIEGAPIMAEGAVFLGRLTNLTALDLKTGKERWSRKTGVSPKAPWEALRCHYRGVLIGLNEQTVWAFSAKDGSPMWTYPCRPRHPNVFGAAGAIWVYVTEADPVLKERWAAVGLDPQTGKEIRKVSLPDEFIRAHSSCHPSCYPMRATERFLILNEQGHDLLDLADGTILREVMSFKRGGCSFGILPANGMFYVPPFQCRCHEAKRYLTGFAAFAPGAGGPSEPEKQGVLEKGPAGEAPPTPVAPAANDWPCLMRDSRRSNATPSDLPGDLAVLWETAPNGPVTSPTLADGIVMVAAKERHTVLAFDANSGKPRWNFTAGARVDTPPTLAGGRCVFGCNDGWVYCLRLNDGQLAWRFRSAPRDRRAVVLDQLESVAPVPGSVLVLGDVVYFTSGRATRLDQGIQVRALDLATGQPRWQTRADAARVPNDILVASGETLRLQAQTFNLKTGVAGKTLGHDKEFVGYSDYSWWGRPKFMVPIPVDRLAFDERRHYGVRWDMPANSGIKHNPVEKVTLVSQGVKKDIPAWETPLPFLGNALCVAKGTVLVAGTEHAPAATEPAGRTPPASYLWLVSGEDGRKLREIPLPGRPVDDGVIVAGGKVFVATADGRILCLGGK